MINLHLDIKDADIVSSDKKEYTYFFKTPIILDEEHTLSCTNAVASMGTDKTTCKTMIVQNNGNYAYVGVSVGDKFDIALADHGYDRGGAIIRIEYIQPPSSTAYMVVDSIVNAGDDFVLNEVFTLDDDALPFERTAGSVAMKLQCTAIEEVTIVVERLDVKLENILYYNPYYCNSDKKYTPTILNYNLIKKGINMLMPQLLLPAQIISNIKLIITDQDEQVRETTDRFNISFCLKKKSDELLDNNYV